MAQTSITDNDERAIQIMKEHNGMVALRTLAKIMMRKGIMSKTRLPLSAVHLSRLSKMYGIEWIGQRKGKKRGKYKKRTIISSTSTSAANSRDESAILELILTSDLHASKKLNALKAIIQGE